jgi:Domain of unknown function (DUF3597)
MGIFSSIKNAIFGTKEEASAPVDAPAVPMSTAPAQPAPQPVVEVDVEANLLARPGADALNWSTSIVDLMKLLGIDSSYANRKALAEELGNTSYEGSAEDNIALHKAVMQALAANGGKVPAAMLD